MQGFYIKELRVTGMGLEDAIIIFDKGLNVINGPSNTGKSYVFKCIDYMFGATELKEIPESKGYDKVYLETRSFENNSPLTLLRLIGNNDIHFAYSNINNFNNVKHQKLKSKHDANKDDNISKFLLKQIGIKDNKVLLTNQDGKKKTLGFRGIANLSLISETDIISETRSPIFNGIKTDDPYCKSIFRFLLTMRDDVLCEEIEKDEIRKAKIDAKIEYINNEISKLIQEKNELQSQFESVSLNEIYDIDSYSDQIENVEVKITEKREMLKAATTLRNDLNLQKNKISLMIDKFNILKDQYINDLQRLTFMQDGEDCLHQITLDHCPLCNGKVSVEFDQNNSSEIIEACQQEEIKIKMHLSELIKAIDTTQAEVDKVNNESNHYEKKIKLHKDEIDKILTKELNPLKVVIALSMEYSNLKSRLKDIENRILDKKREITGFDENKKQQRTKLNYDSNIPKEIYDELCEEIKKTLMHWGFVGVKSVTFDVGEQDIMIDGTERKTNGKGFRAYFYAAFAVSLMNYLLSKEHPYTRVLVLDSPVTTLKEDEIEKGNVEDGDLIEISLQDSLFVSLAKSCVDKQVIILENKELPKQLDGKCNHIAFVKGRRDGRYGFFPLK